MNYLQAIRELGSSSLAYNLLVQGKLEPVPSSQEIEETEPQTIDLGGMQTKPIQKKLVGRYIRKKIKCRLI